MIVPAAITHSVGPPLCGSTSAPPSHVVVSIMVSGKLIAAASAELGQIANEPMPSQPSGASAAASRNECVLSAGTIGPASSFAAPGGDPAANEHPATRYSAAVPRMRAA